MQMQALLRRRAFFVLGTMVASALAGCSLLISTSDLSRDDQGASASDGGDGAILGDGPQQPSSDAPVTPSSDAGSDAPFCKSLAGGGASHTLCADFDSDPVTQGWSGVVDDQGGTVTRETVASGASVLAARVPASAGSERSGRLYYQVAYLPRRVHAEMDLIPCPNTKGFFEMFKVELVTTPNQEAAIGFRSKMFLFGRDDTTWGVGVSGNIADGGQFDDVLNFNRPIPLNVQSHVSIDITLPPTPIAHLKVLLDRNESQPLLDVDLPTPNKDIQTATLVLGTFTAGAPEACTNRFDNVLLDAIP